MSDVLETPTKRRKCRPWLTRTIAERISDMRRTWMALEDHAAMAVGYVGRSAPNRPQEFISKPIPKQAGDDPKTKAFWTRILMNHIAAPPVLEPADPNRPETYWERKARRWKYWADAQHEYLKREVQHMGVPMQKPRDSFSDFVDWMKDDEPEPNYTTDNEMESLTL